MTFAGADKGAPLDLQLNCTLLSDLKTLGIVNNVISEPIRIDVIPDEVKPMRDTETSAGWVQFTWKLAFSTNVKLVGESVN